MRLKILLFMTIILAAISCSAPKRLIIYHAIDFRPYADSGFYFYTGECLKDHQQLGVIHMEIPGIIVKGKSLPNQGRFEDSVYSKGAIFGQIVPPTDKEILDNIVAVAKGMGGNGIAHLEITYGEVLCYIKGTVVLCR